jgi:hypothetical protein
MADPAHASRFVQAILELELELVRSSMRGLDQQSLSRAGSSHVRGSSMWGGTSPGGPGPGPLLPAGWALRLWGSTRSTVNRPPARRFLPYRAQRNREAVKLFPVARLARDCT